MRIMRLDEVLERTGLSRSTVRRLEKDGLFPTRLKIAPGAIGWLETDIDDWIRELPPGPQEGRNSSKAQPCDSDQLDLFDEPTGRRQA